MELVLYEIATVGLDIVKDFVCECFVSTLHPYRKSERVGFHGNDPANVQNRIQSRNICHDYCSDLVLERTRKDRHRES